MFMDLYRTGAPTPPPPHPAGNCGGGGGVFVNSCIYFHCIQHAMFTYVFYSLLSKQKHKVCVKGHQNNLQTPGKTVLPGFVIPGSTTAFKFTSPQT